MAVDTRILQGEVYDGTETEKNVEKLLQGFVDALFTELSQQGREE